ncbi:MFS transporter [Shewanella xiamenensis]|uniref:MFS transporter n=1 Tax=Shewanella xiamenensis TaxID=332186 RepID=A0AAW6QT11_9GAMM|nr:MULTISPECIES: MFS transporter [Shewanella]MDG5899024.1 MFS transporter [Shewanella xiamenensis]MDN5501866.1 MFS transporter [Shewanella sp.]MDN5529748.1 MFS transporter [Shewanella sp.]
MFTISSTSQQLRWLCACYFFFFSILGTMIPYLGVFFENRGFNPQEIGFLLAILMATRIVAPNVWAKVADRTGMRSELIKMGAGAAMLAYLSFFYHGGFVYMALSLALYTFFWNAILAQLEVITLETLGENASRYGQIRSFGSIGYICLVVGAGFAIGQWGTEVLPYIGLVLFTGMLVCALPLPANRAMRPQGQERQPLKWTKPILWFMVSAMLLQMSAGPFYGFFVLYLKQAGYTEAAAGIFVALGAMAEIVMFMFAPRLLGRYGVNTLLVVSIAMTAVRWLLVAFGVESMLLLGLSQVLHAFTFGLTHAASIQFVHRNFDASHRSQGQALYASLSFGVGGALGTWICGYIWGDGSGAVWSWVFAAACAFTAMLAVFLIPKDGAQAVAS